MSAPSSMVVTNYVLLLSSQNVARSAGRCAAGVTKTLDFRLCIEKPGQISP